MGSEFVFFFCFPLQIILYVTTTTVAVGVACIRVHLWMRSGDAVICFASFAVVVATVSISSARRWWHVVAKGNFNGSWSVANRQILHVEPRVHIVGYQHEAWVLNHFHFISTNTKQQHLLDFIISTCCYYPSNRMRRMHPLLHDTVSPLLLMRAVKKTTKAAWGGEAKVVCVVHI